MSYKTNQINQLEQEYLGTLLRAPNTRILHTELMKIPCICFYLLKCRIILRTVGYQQAAVNEDKKDDAQTALNVKDLEDRKKALVTKKLPCESQSDTDTRAAAVRKLLAQVDAYAGQLQSAVAAVSARQQEFFGTKTRWAWIHYSP